MKAEWRHGLPDKDKFKFITHDGFGKLRLEQSGQTHIVEEQEFTARKKTNNKWFETQDQIGYWDDFSKPKIVWGEISDKTKFAVDAAGDFCAEATTFLMTGVNLPYLVCYLNSSLSEYLFSKIGTTTGVGTVRWKKFKIEQLFVPIVGKDTESNWLDRLRLLANGEITESDINYRIYALCKLSPEEISFVESYSASI